MSCTTRADRELVRSRRAGCAVQSPDMMVFGGVRRRFETEF